MSTYLEIDSKYRNRNLWPIPGEFEIPISQTGTKDKKDALDPVCLSEPLVSWSVDALASNLALSPDLTGRIANGSFSALGDRIGATSNNLDFIINIGLDDFRNIIPQQIENYMVGLVLQDIQNIGTPIIGRIVSYKYLGTIGPSFPLFNSSRCLITLDAPLTGWGYDDVIRIIDPTDYKNPSYPLFFIPNGVTQDNAYSNYILYNENTNDYRSITLYDAAQAIISTEPWLVVWPINSTYNFSIRKIPPVFPLQLENSLFASITSTNNIVLCISALSNSLSQSTDFYKNYFLRLRPYRSGVSNTGIYTNTIISQSRRIIGYSYTSLSNTYSFTVYPAFTQIDFATQTYSIEIEEFSYDNFNPFTYIGTLVEQASCYEFELINLILPNYTLSSGNGSKIAFYPFVYVVLSNVSASSSHLRNILYSNNPNAVKVIFRVPIYDIQDPETTPFIRLVYANIVQVMKFKPNDNLYFSVLLPNGDIFNTLLPEYYSPAAPNAQSQVSAIFRYKRIE